MVMDKVRGTKWLTWGVVAMGMCVAMMLCVSGRNAQPGPPLTEMLPQTSPNTSSQTPTAAPTAKPATGPLSGLTVLVDPGHGGYDGGARCQDSGVWEKVLNLAVAQRVQTALEQAGARVVMTRDADEDLCTDHRPASVTKKREDMERRVALAREQGADMVLSIHMNEYRSRSESGPQVFYREGSAGGRLLAGCIQEALVQEMKPRRERSAMAGDYFILQLEVPSVLVECGFISNPQEEKLLLQEDYQERLAQAIVAGVEEYLRVRPEDEETAWIFETTSAPGNC